MLVVASAVVLVALAAVVLWIVSWFGCLHRAAAVADLSAAAGAEAFAAGTDACEMATQVARRNASRLISCRSGGDPMHFVVRVEVAVPLEPHVPGAPKEVTGQAAAGSVG